MATFTWKAAVVATLLLQAAVLPAQGAPQGLTGGGVVATYSTDSSGHTEEKYQHLNAQQAQQLFLENQQKLQSLFAANAFGGLFSPWLLPPIPTLPFHPFTFPFPFLPAFAYLPAAFAANANNIVATANQAAVNNAARSKETVDHVVGKIASASSAISSAVASATATSSKAK
ncbi:Mitochondrial import inner membrane translocase subunit tim21 [Frankliniella fusca]|uniref:Mitochondrial import inner membrane translocase subunit tim21 n=1 Tax=Frankliniella fusca TaxID=407009 RepID=A0AAE1HRA4_9NEOP|nr:Mitochondrial import inner membrane translocase subunit tim21 [Frankliniella fusca]